MAFTNAHDALSFGALIYIIASLMFVMASYNFLASNATTQRMHTFKQATGRYLRQHKRDFPHYSTLGHSLLRKTEETFSSSPEPKIDITTQNQGLVPSSIWEDKFFIHLLGKPMLHDLQKKEDLFSMVEDENEISLTLAIPNIDLEDIVIEVVGGRVIHIHGDQMTDSAHVKFCEKFSIGHNLDETNLKAKLNKGGKLVVTAPKLDDEKVLIRNIPVVSVDEF